jgi:hypothetical protein
VVLAEALLSSGRRSDSAALAVAVACSVPRRRGVTSTRTVASAPAASAPSSQITGVDPLQLPCDDWLARQRTVDGRGSVTRTADAGVLPALRSAAI